MPVKVEGALKALDALSKIAVLIGIVFFFVQQENDAHARRSENAMRFIELASVGEVAETETALSSPWANLDLSALEGAALSTAAVNKLKKDSIDAAVRSGALRETQIVRLADFYSTVLMCRRTRTCDDAIVDEFFRSRIRGFYCLYDTRLDTIARRRNQPTAYAPLKAYAESCAGEAFS